MGTKELNKSTSEQIIRSNEKTTKSEEIPNIVKEVSVTNNVDKNKKIIQLYSIMNQKSKAIHELTHNLLDKINIYILEFQAENLPITRIAEYLKKCIVKIGSYMIRYFF